jgi:cytochrome d ubiquinol oxidase subunit II
VQIGSTNLIRALLITFTAPFLSETKLHRRFDPAFLPFFMLLPLVGTALIVQLFRSLAMGLIFQHFAYTALLFSLSFVGVGVMVFPAVSPPFIGVLIPIMLFYNINNSIAFRGKIAVSPQ